MVNLRWVSKGIPWGQVTQAWGELQDKTGDISYLPSNVETKKGETGVIYESERPLKVIAYTCLEYIKLFHISQWEWHFLNFQNQHPFVFNDSVNLHCFASKVNE